MLRRAAQLVELCVCLLQRHFLNQHRLRQNVQRVGPCADGAADQIVGVAIYRLLRRVSDSFGQSGNQLLFLFGHLVSLPYGTAARGRPFRVQQPVASV